MTDWEVIEQHVQNMEEALVQFQAPLLDPGGGNGVPECWKCEVMSDGF